MSKVSKEDYDKYVSNFMKDKEKRKNKEEELNQMFREKLGFSPLVSDCYDDEPKSFDDYVIWVENEEKRKKIAEEEHKERVKKMIEKDKENEIVFNNFLTTLPQNFTPKEWREIVKTLPIKYKPIPRGTKQVIVSKSSDRSIKIEYKN